MPTATKATFSLDSGSIERLNRLVDRWRVSKSEVLRRALMAAEESNQSNPLTPQERIAALHQLQRMTKERGVDFAEWQRTIRDARR